MNSNQPRTEIGPLPNELLKQIPSWKPEQMDVATSISQIPKEMLEAVKNYKSVLAKKRGYTRLTTEQQLELMELIARFSSIREIQEYFITYHKLPISLNLVSQYKRTKKWHPLIQELRNKYICGTDQVALSHKRVRMERREIVFKQAMKTNQLRSALIAVRDAEVEMGGGQGRAPGSVNITLNQYNELSDIELEAKRTEILERIQRKQNVIQIPKET